jgi:hypothetical protein
VTLNLFRFIERVLDHGMTVWLDLLATPNDKLGVLEEFGSTVTPDEALKVVKYIAKKYDPRVSATFDDLYRT